MILSSCIIPFLCVDSKYSGEDQGAIGGFISAIITWFVVTKIFAGEITINALGSYCPMLFCYLAGIVSSGLIIGIITSMKPKYDDQLWAWRSKH